ncbi:MAG: hypothetical protein JWM32_3101 [Verrucomicrobia bacterium]|nr:hypothetical protein [Verrucomicrobiota bacterium]
MDSPAAIFFSWQSDTAKETNHRAFIRRCLELATKELNASVEIDDALRVDAGMEGIPGTPEVAAAIFEKIAAASFFVADVTLVATGNFSPERRQPNSNVSIEMGFAAGVLGWDRVICIMDAAYGKPEHLPFDHRNRRFPITYSSRDEPAPAKLKLTKALTSALALAETHELNKVGRAIRRLDVNALRLIADFGREEYFSDPTGSGNQVDLYYQKIFPVGIPRLLDLGLIYADAQPATKLYAYHWTYLGKKVVQKLDFPIQEPGILFL